MLETPNICQKKCRHNGEKPNNRRDIYITAVQSKLVKFVKPEAKH